MFAQDPRPRKVEPKAFRIRSPMTLSALAYHGSSRSNAARTRDTELGFVA